MLCNLHQLVLCVLGKVAESWQCFFCMGGLTNAASSSSSCPAKTAKTRNNYMPGAAFRILSEKASTICKKTVFIPKKPKNAQH
jgi:hypothetical protein